MPINNFEDQFERFLAHIDYERASDAIFNVTRSAFIAGWLAAGEKPPVPHQPYVRKKAKDTENTTEYE